MRSATRGKAIEVQLSVRHKLIAAMLAASVIVTVAMGFATQTGFRRSFLDFLNEQSVARLEAIEPKVIAIYQRSNSWEYLRANPRAWFEAIGIPGGGPPSVPVNKSNAAPFPLGDVDVTGTGIRLTLLDEQHHFLIGYPQLPPDGVYRTLMWQGRTIGWLALAPVRQARNMAETNFQRRQLRLTWIIGGLAVALCAAIAALLSNAFLNPIRHIAGVTQRLAAGDYSARVASSPRDEIGRLAGDVNHLALALERNESMRRNLMADVSHELRTPLAVLRAELEALWDGVRTLSRDSLASLLAEVTTLNKLVDDLHELAIADLGALTYRKHMVDISEILTTCVAAFHERFEQGSLNVQLETAAEGPLIMADENRIQQLFNNLLDNSAKYTDAGGQIRISCRAAGTKVLIRIEDSAPGVAPENLRRLFERFFRVDSPRRDSRGSGLGMAICHSIVEAHGGAISAAPSAIGGLRIDIQLPRVQS